MAVQGAPNGLASPHASALGISNYSAQGSYTCRARELEIVKNSKSEMEL